MDVLHNACDFRFCIWSSQHAHTYLSMFCTFHTLPLLSFFCLFLLSLSFWFCQGFTLVFLRLFRALFYLVGWRGSGCGNRLRRVRSLCVRDSLFELQMSVLGGCLPGLEVHGVLLLLISGVGVSVLIAGEEALEDFLESTVISGFSSGMLHFPLMCSNSCTCTQCKAHMPLQYSNSSACVHQSIDLIQLGGAQHKRMLL